MEMTTAIKALQGLYSFASTLKNLRKRKIYGIVMSSNTGKTTLCQNLKGDGVKVVDLDKYTYNLYLTKDEQSLVDKLKTDNPNEYDIFFNAKAKKYVEQLKKDYPTEKLVMVGSLKSVLKSVGCNEIRHYAPDEKLFNDIRKDLEDENDINQMIGSRVRLVSDAGDNLLLFSNWDNLQNDIKKWLKIKVVL